MEERTCWKDVLLVIMGVITLAGIGMSIVNILSTGKILTLSYILILHGIWTLIKFAALAIAVIYLCIRGVTGKERSGGLRTGVSTVILIIIYGFVSLGLNLSIGLRFICDIISLIVRLLGN